MQINSHETCSCTVWTTLGCNCHTAHFSVIHWIVSVASSQNFSAPAMLLLSALSTPCSNFDCFGDPLTSLRPHLRCWHWLWGRGRVAGLTRCIVHCDMYCCIMMRHNSTSSSNRSVDMIVSISPSLALSSKCLCKFLYLRYYIPVKS